MKNCGLHTNELGLQPLCRGVLGPKSDDVCKLKLTMKKKNMAGPVMDAACATYEGISFELDLFPRTKEPVWVLGKEYITDRGNDALFSH